MAIPDNGQIPNHTYHALKRYVEDRVQPGSFLTAVFSNDLKLACVYVDKANQHFIFELVRYIYNNIPFNCWGSPQRVQDWLEGKDIHEEQKSEVSTSA